MVTGIKTTLPFFSWLLAQEAFIAGRFHTTYLDEELKTRNGRPFVEATPELDEIAAIGAAVQTVLSRESAAPDNATTHPAVTGGWRTQARLDGLR